LPRGDEGLFQLLLSAGAGALDCPDLRSVAGESKGRWMRRTLCSMLLLVLLLANVAAASPRSTRSARSKTLGRTIDHYRQETWRWQRLMGRPRTPVMHEQVGGGSGYRVWLLRLWEGRAARAWRLARRPPHRTAWLCIHSYEGRWTDPNPPYYGGLQMDLGFQRAYGADLLRRHGTADKWTPLEQMWVAERAYRSGTGFWPWPNTARYCGLL
jgi:hypothetical protein